MAHIASCRGISDGSEMIFAVSLDRVSRKVEAAFLGY